MRRNISLDSMPAALCTSSFFRLKISFLHLKLLTLKALHFLHVKVFRLKTPLPVRSLLSVFDSGIAPSILGNSDVFENQLLATARENLVAVVTFNI